MMPSRRHSDHIKILIAMFLDWIEDRNMDKHLAAIAIFCVSVRITEWAIGFATEHWAKSGLETAAIIGSLTGPWSVDQTYALKYWFASIDSTLKES